MPDKPSLSTTMRIDIAPEADPNAPKSVDIRHHRSQISEPRPILGKKKVSPPRPIPSAALNSESSFKASMMQP